MQGQATPKKSVTSLRTATPGVYLRAKRYVAQWVEDGKTCRRSFPTYEAACAFRRDYIIPHRERTALPPSTVAPPRRGGSWVYVFQSEGPGMPVKVGFSSDPARRLRDLSHASPHLLHLMLLVPGGRAMETALHERIEPFRMQGEWYSREALTTAADLLWRGLDAALVV